MTAYRDRRSGRWRYRKWITLPDGRRERVAGTPATDTRKAAEHAEAMHVLRVMNPGMVQKAAVATEAPEKKEVMTFKEFVDGHYMEKMRTTGNKKGRNKPSTLSAKESHLRTHLMPRFGDRPLDEIDEIMIDDLKIELGRLGRSPKTINNVLTTVFNILKNAKARRLIATVPNMEWVLVGEQEFDFLDFDETERLLAGAAKVEDWSCAILLAAKTGMRLGELRALRWQDVDLVAGRLQVCRNLWQHHEGTPKNGKSRTLDLPSSALTALKGHRHLRGKRVFLAPSGEDYSMGEWRHGLYKACRRAGLREIGWHTLRHTFASHLAMRGVPIRAIQELMGHRTIQMTMRYSHLAPGATRAAVATLDLPAPDFGQPVGNSAANRL